MFRQAPFPFPLSFPLFAPDDRATGGPGPDAEKPADPPREKKKREKLRLDAGTWRLVKRISRDHVRKRLKMVLGALVFMLLSAGSASALPYVIKYMLDDALNAGDMDSLYAIAIFMPLLGMVRGGAAWGHSVLMHSVALGIIRDIQNMMFGRILRQDLSFFSENATGNLISRVTFDTHQLRNGLERCILGIGRDLTMLVGLTASMFWLNWQLAILAFFVIPLAVFPITRIGRRLRKVSVNTQESMERVTTLLDETIRGNRQVKAYGMEDSEDQRFGEATNDLCKLQIKGIRTRSLSHPVMETMIGSVIALVILVGGHLVITDASVTAGDFLGFLTAALMTYQPMRSLASLNSALQEGVAASQRIYGLIDSAPQIQEAENARVLDLEDGPEIRFENVCFRYDDKKVLNNLSLTVPARKKVALVGPSGAGKSTILNLIPRFYDIENGAVRIHGVDIREATLSSLRAQAALVAQEVVLFDDTIRANIAYGRPGASEDDIETAARLAGAHDFITGFEDGYDTHVGPRGTRLSGGQAQRVSIARAMLKDAPILLLDEATSALDTESERHIQRALHTLMEGRTTLVIAHRLSTVMDADIIYVIENGEVAEHGTHAELLEAKGPYARLYALQFAAESESEALASRLHDLHEDSTVLAGQDLKEG